jgi:BON domain
MRPWCVWLACALVSAAPAQERRNIFNDPFVQITSALPSCPEPRPPGVTEQEARDQAHDRSQRGVSCWLDGRCRLHNAYLYDAEIIPRVHKAIGADGRLRDTSIWALGQRRHVWLQGCVSSQDQSTRAEALARGLDDVEGVVNQLMVGTAGQPPYVAASPR